VRTLAFQSLQSEHNNLLAAFSRSQTRASALERKHAVSDLEVNNLTEERIALQAKVLELEQNVEDLSRSRSQARQVAVQEGAQYVKIVKMASRMEELAMKERKNWNNMKADMEQRIQMLESARGSRDANTLRQGAEAESSSAAESRFQETGGSVHGDESELIRELKMEVARLKAQCHEFETALLNIRTESQALESSIETLGETGKRIMGQVQGKLGSTTPSGAAGDASGLPAGGSSSTS